MCRWLICVALLLATSACSQGETGQEGVGRGFDYYLLSLSWSPQFCAQTQRTDEPQCSQPFGFIAHGLWPQNEHGYPQDCPVSTRVSDATIERMLPIMPSRGLVIHEWRSHGACTSLTADAYFVTVTRAWSGVTIPERYRSTQSVLSTDPASLKQDFVQANPKLPQQAIRLECSGQYLQEVRICMDRNLTPRACGSDVRDHCGDADVVLRPMR